MPVKAEKRGDKWRVVEVATGKIAMTPNGHPRDGGGHPSEAAAERQVRAMNSNRRHGR